MHVGLLEDDMAIQEMLLLVLQDEGYGVTAYQEAEECIEVLTRVAQDSSAPVPVDLMIVDWRLSGPLSGIEVIQQLRAQPRLGSLPIILTTAATFSDSSILQELRVVLLEKPFSVDDMTVLVKQLIQAHLTIS
jgi:two-component system chemotaxis response regulator CheY